jgi:AraC family L-rhamnose operon regulatory protein RhaS
VRQQLAPIYQTRRTRHEIDRCVPQRRAIAEGKIRFHALSKGHYPGKRMKATSLPGLNSIGYWDASEPQDWGLEAHRNEGVEISFLETGVMDFTVDRQHFEVHAGDFIVTRPWQLHRLGGPNIGPGRLHWLILDVGVRRPNQEWRWPAWVSLTPPDRAALTRQLRHNENPVWKSSPEIATSFRGLAECIRRWNQPHMESRMLNLLNQLLLGLLDASTQHLTHENAELALRRRTVELFLRDLTENAASSSEAWTLGKMAAQCGLGITSFSKYCRELVNAGPVEFLNRCRLDQAARLLKANPKLPVTETAFRCGFNSSQYFATSFRRRFRKTPRAYRDTRTTPSVAAQ